MVKREMVERGAAAQSSAFSASGPHFPPPAAQSSPYTGPQFQFSPASVPPGPHSAALFLTPDTPTPPYGPPVHSGQFSQSNPPFYPPSGSQWSDILNNLRQQQPLPSRDPSRDPSSSNYGPAGGVKPEPGPSQPSQPEPSPVFSPVPARQRSIISPPPPGKPLPPIGDLFAPMVEDQPQPVLELAKSASSLNCSRLRCDWTDPHVETCKRRKIQARCEGRACTPDDLHALGFKSGSRAALTPCPQLQEMCKIRGPLVKRILLPCLNSGSADTSCREKSTVSMRLLYRRTNKSLKDPRIGREDNAGTSQHTAAKVLPTQGRGTKWGSNTIIATWSAISMVRVVPGQNNPNLQQQESDHDSDIECLD